MAWRRTGDRPLLEVMLLQFADAYMRHWMGQWVSIECNGMVMSYYIRIVEFGIYIKLIDNYLKVYFCHILYHKGLQWSIPRYFMHLSCHWNAISDKEWIYPFKINRTAEFTCTRIIMVILMYSLPFVVFWISQLQYSPVPKTSTIIATIQYMYHTCFSCVFLST